MNHDDGTCQVTPPPPGLRAFAVWTDMATAGRPAGKEPPYVAGPLLVLAIRTWDESNRVDVLVADDSDTPWITLGLDGFLTTQAAIEAINMLRADAGLKPVNQFQTTERVPTVMWGGTG